jgi:hypothetical protein
VESANGLPAVNVEQQMQQLIVDNE